MTKKLTLLMAVIAAVALAAPALASAAPSITSSAGVLAPKGTKITGSSTNMVLQTSVGKITCAKVTINEEITENTGSSVKGVGLGEGTTSTCKLGEKSITITDFTTTFTYVFPSTFHLEVTFTAHLPSLTCHFSGPVGASVTVGGNHITIGPSADLVGTPAPCEPSLLNGTFSFEQTGGGSIIFD